MENDSGKDLLMRALTREGSADAEEIEELTVYALEILGDAPAETTREVSYAVDDEYRTIRLCAGIVEDADGAYKFARIEFFDADDEGTEYGQFEYNHNNDLVGPGVNFEGPFKENAATIKEMIELAFIQGELSDDERAILERIRQYACVLQGLEIEEPESDETNINMCDKVHAVLDHHEIPSVRIAETSLITTDGREIRLTGYKYEAEVERPDLFNAEDRPRLDIEVRYSYSDTTESFELFCDGSVVGRTIDPKREMHQDYDEDIDEEADKIMRKSGLSKPTKALVSSLKGALIEFERTEYGIG